jgi:AcrR family transcriptional regulator
VTAAHFPGLGAGAQLEGRRAQLAAEAARLFAVRGFHGVSLGDLGAAAGISGPAVYKHFASKDAVLAEVLVGISERLLAGARAVIAETSSPHESLIRLLAAHTEFALSRPDLIRVQDRDLANLSAGEARRVRRLQRAYVEIWVDVLRALDPALSTDDARTSAHAVFGLLNSTPHSAAAGSVGRTNKILQRMALAALNVAEPAENGSPR